MVRSSFLLLRLCVSLYMTMMTSTTSHVFHLTRQAHARSGLCIYHGVYPRNVKAPKQYDMFG